MVLHWLFLVFCSLLLRLTATTTKYEHCRQEYSKSLVCSNMDDEVDLEEDLRDSRKLKLRELVIANSSLRFLPHDAFRGTSFQIIKILNSNFLSFSNTDVAFEGLENSLTELYLDNCSLVNHLRIQHLKNLRISSLYITNSDLDHVTDDLSSTLPSLFFIRLNNNHINWVHPNAFATLTRLSVVRMAHNKIPAIQRSMFPRPTINLNIIDLNYNQLRALPTDIFTDMPNLIVVNLDGNKFTTLDERVFGRVVTRFEHLSMQNNPFYCDCRVKWLAEHRSKLKRIYAECTAPSRLKGRSLMELNHRELWC